MEAWFRGGETFCLTTAGGGLGQASDVHTERVRWRSSGNHSRPRRPGDICLSFEWPPSEVTQLGSRVHALLA